MITLVDMARPLSVTRPALVPPDDLAAIEAAAYRILAEVGIRVGDDEPRARLAKAGFRVSGDRVFVEPAQAKAFVAETRGKASGPEAGGTPDPFSLQVAQYPPFLHDSADDSIRPFTMATLAEAVKLLDVLADRGVCTSPCGQPSDVPPAVQAVGAYWTAATYSRQGRSPVDGKTEAAVPFVMEMAEVLGEPVRHLPVYMFSPLSLEGESFRIVLKLRDRLAATSVGGMPSPGTSAPIRVGDAFAMAAAEAIGGAILVRELTKLTVHWYVNIFPTDLKAMTMTFGSPENFLFHAWSMEVNAFLHGAHWSPAPFNLHLNAKLPGAQACAERASLMTLGAALGARYFEGGGTLGLDEIHSPEQLLYDLEILDHVRRLHAGTDTTADAARAVAEVAEGVRDHGFAGVESTGELHRSLYWTPKLFDRDFLTGWRARGEPTIRARARALLAELRPRHDFHLPDAEQRAIDAIWAKAVEGT
jgi:trimethylamine:corrinoid methyltransferase-like protein